MNTDITQEAPQNILPEAINKINTIVSSSTKIEDALIAAQRAKDKAEEAASKKTDILHRKEAIEALQSSEIEQSNVLFDVVYNQKELFDALKINADATRKLFFLSTGNLATTQAVIQAIQSKDFSSETMSENAKKNLLEVLKQLKAQEDLYLRLEGLSNKCKELNKKIEDIKGFDNDDARQKTINGLYASILQLENDLDEELKKNKQESISASKSYIDVKIKQETERADKAYDALGSANRAAETAKKEINSSAQKLDQYIKETKEADSKRDERLGNIDRYINETKEADSKRDERLGDIDRYINETKEAVSKRDEHLGNIDQNINNSRVEYQELLSSYLKIKRSNILLWFGIIGLITFELLSHFLFR